MTRSHQPIHPAVACICSRSCVPPMCPPHTFPTFVPNTFPTHAGLSHGDTGLPRERRRVPPTMPPTLRLIRIRSPHTFPTCGQATERRYAPQMAHPRHRCIVHRLFMEQPTCMLKSSFGARSQCMHAFGACAQCRGNESTPFLGCSSSAGRAGRAGRAPPPRRRHQNLLCRAQLLRSFWPPLQRCVEP
jgi:hypothetical protein